jgi:hypothetical protein
VFIVVLESLGALPSKFATICLKGWCCYIRLQFIIDFPRMAMASRGSLDVRGLLANTAIAFRQVVMQLATAMERFRRTP